MCKSNHGIDLRQVRHLFFEGGCIAARWILDIVTLSRELDGAASQSVVVGTVGARSVALVAASCVFT